MKACAEFAPRVEQRLTESLGEEGARVEEHRALEGLPRATWRELERARVRGLFTRSGLGLVAAAAAVALFVWPHAGRVPAAVTAPAALASTAVSGADELDLGFAGDEDDDDLDLEDFASLDGSGAMASASGTA